MRSRVRSKEILSSFPIVNPCTTVGDGWSWSTKLRVYFGRRGRYLMLLLAGGGKGSQRRDIQKAKAFWAVFVKESKHG